MQKLVELPTGEAKSSQRKSRNRPTRNWTKKLLAGRQIMSLSTDCDMVKRSSPKVQLSTKPGTEPRTFWLVVRDLTDCANLPHFAVLYLWWAEMPMAVYKLTFWDLRHSPSSWPVLPCQSKRTEPLSYDSKLWTCRRVNNYAQNLPPASNDS